MELVNRVFSGLPGTAHENGLAPELEAMNQPFAESIFAKRFAPSAGPRHSRRQAGLPGDKLARKAAAGELTKTRIR